MYEKFNKTRKILIKTCIIKIRLSVTKICCFKKIGDFAGQFEPNRELLSGCGLLPLLVMT